MLAPGEDQSKYVLHSNGSQCHVGALLSQKRQDGETRVIAKERRELNSAEKWYLIYDKDFRAMQDSVIYLNYDLRSDRDVTIHMNISSSNTYWHNLDSQLDQLRR